MATPQLPDTTRALYPFASHFFTLSDGTQLHYLDEGPRDGAPLVLLHSYPLWSFEFRALIVYYAALGWRCIAPDYVGCGLSDKPVARRYHTLTQHTANLTALLNSLELADITLVMEDWGGPLGLHYALAHQDQIKRLVLLNTWAFQNTIEHRLHPLVRLVTRPGIGEVLLGTFNLAFALGVQRWTARELSWAVLNAYRAPFRDRRHRAALVQFPRMINTTPAHPSAAIMRDIESQLDALRRIPTLIVWGADDPVFPPDVAQHWKSLLPRAVGPVLIEGAGHYLPEDASNTLVCHLDRFFATT